MNFYGAFINGLREILAHKMRSLLSMSGIILGVAALVAMVSVVQGMVGQFKGFIEMQGGIEKITISTLRLLMTSQSDIVPVTRALNSLPLREMLVQRIEISGEIWETLGTSLRMASTSTMRSPGAES